VRADIRNLLNEKQESWLGAPGQRFNFQVGLLWKF
jgi:outer membrane receptor protein involved in Fe transport